MTDSATSSLLMSTETKGGVSSTVEPRHHHSQYVLPIGASTYGVTLTLSGDSISLRAEEIITKECYSITMKEVEIISYTKSCGVELNATFFHALILDALTAKNPLVKFDLTFEEASQRIHLDITLTTPLYSNSLMTTYVLTLNLVEQKDVDRIGRMLLDFHRSRNEATELIKTHQEQIDEKISAKLAVLEKELMSEINEADEINDTLAKITGELKTLVETQAQSLTELKTLVETQAQSLTELKTLVETQAKTLAAQQAELTALKTASTAQQTELTALKTASTAQQAAITALKTPPAAS